MAFVFCSGSSAEYHPESSSSRDMRKAEADEGPKGQSGSLKLADSREKITMCIDAVRHITLLGS